jgi:hypothetical protein
MSFDLVSDRNVCSYLDTYSFCMFRVTCKTHYNDEEAWSIRSSRGILNVPSLNHKQTLGLNYLMKYALMFESPTGSTSWFQEIVNWLEYKISIKIFHSFIYNSAPNLMFQLHFHKLSPSAKFHWERLWHRYQRVYKIRKWNYENSQFNVRKKRRILCY